MAIPEEPAEETSKEPLATYQLGDSTYAGEIKEEPLGSQFLHTALGTYRWKLGTTYEGPFVNSRIEGKGKLSWPDGSSYEGDLHEGMRHGEGVYRKGEVLYSGQWCMGQREGFGRLDYEGNAFYEGDWKAGKKHGRGKQLWASGNVYEGEWRKGKMSGFGVMSWRTTEVYEGEWEESKPHGEGTHTWFAAEPDAEASQQQQINRYVGQWRFGKRHGRGTFYYANGAKYEGEWVEHVKQGMGRHTFEEGHVYAGRFEDDRMCDYTAPAENEESPTAKLIDISDLAALAMPDDHRGFEATLGNGYSEPEKVLKEVHNTLLRNLSELKELYKSYRAKQPRPGADPFLMQNYQLWMLARDLGLATPQCTLARLCRFVFAGPRHFSEAAPEASGEARPLTPRGDSDQGSLPEEPSVQASTLLTANPEGSVDGESLEEASLQEASLQEASVQTLPAEESPELELPLLGPSPFEACAASIHEPDKPLLFRHFLEGVVRMAVARFPHERGLEAQVGRLFREQLLPLQKQAISEEEPWAFLLEPALDAAEIRGIFPVHSKQRRSKVQARIDETFRLKDVLRGVHSAGLLKPWLASELPADDPFAALFPEEAVEEEEEKADLRARPLSLLRSVTEVMAEGAPSSVRWELDAERFWPGGEQLSLLDFLELELLLPEVQRLLLTFQRKADRDSEPFFREVLLPALKGAPYSPPAEEAAALPEETQAEEEEPSSERTEPPQELEFWLGFDEGGPEEPRAWPAGYEDEVSEW